MRFLLKAGPKDKGGLTGKGVFLRVRYAEAGSYQVLHNGKKIPFNTWNTDLGKYSPVTKAFCGENRYVGIKNFMEFYLTPGCEI